MARECYFSWSRNLLGIVWHLRLLTSARCQRDSEECLVAVFPRCLNHKRRPRDGYGHRAEVSASRRVRNFRLPSELERVCGATVVFLQYTTLQTRRVQIARCHGSVDSLDACDSASWELCWILERRNASLMSSRNFPGEDVDGDQGEDLCTRCCHLRPFSGYLDVRTVLWCVRSRCFRNRPPGYPRCRSGRMVESQ